MIRASLLATALLLATTGAHAQDDASLTKEFAGMSAKERTKLAKQEVEEAAKDDAFQAMMAQAEVAFKAGRFVEARQHYADARTRRPLNVYPKVKLEDLDALIAKRAAEAKAAEPVVVDPPPVVLFPISATNTTTVPITTDPSPTPTTIVEKAPVQTITAPVKTANKSVVEVPTIAPLTEGEREYMEGNAKVLEIAVAEHKHLAVYKKVKHPWGQVFYFKDGASVGQRVWQARFGAR